MKKKCIRHGEILLVEIDKLPENLTQSKSKVIMQGSHGHDHSIDNGKFYPKKVDDIIFGYLVSENTHLLHEEHSPKKGDAKIPDGIWELRKGREIVNGELRPIID